MRFVDFIPRKHLNTHWTCRYQSYQLLVINDTYTVDIFSLLNNQGIIPNSSANSMIGAAIEKVRSSKYNTYVASLIPDIIIVKAFQSQV